VEAYVLGKYGIFDGRAVAALPRLSHLAVIIPLAEGARDRAVALLAQRPQFDSGEEGLMRYEVFLTANEVVLHFEVDSRATLERLVADWAGAWQELVVGPPRIAESVFSWERHESRDFVSAEPTPGPGDSDGGDIFSP
jgi:hypothetical protein